MIGLHKPRPRSFCRQRRESDDEEEAGEDALETLRQERQRLRGELARAVRDERNERKPGLKGKSFKAR